MCINNTRTGKFEKTFKTNTKNYYCCYYNLHEFCVRSLSLSLATVRLPKFEAINTKIYAGRDFFRKSHIYHSRGDLLHPYDTNTMIGDCLTLRVQYRDKQVLICNTQSLTVETLYLSDVFVVVVRKLILSFFRVFFLHIGIYLF